MRKEQMVGSRLPVQLVNFGPKNCATAPERNREPLQKPLQWPSKRMPKTCGKLKRYKYLPGWRN
jgi:hypothetical protein